jgi:hypothetical protein
MYLIKMVQGHTFTARSDTLYLQIIKTSFISCKVNVVLNPPRDDYLH